METKDSSTVVPAFVRLPAWREPEELLRTSAPKIPTISSSVEFRVKSFREPGGVILSRAPEVAVRYTLQMLSNDDVTALAKRTFTVLV